MIENPYRLKSKAASDPIFDLHEIKGYKSPKRLRLLISSNNLITNEIRIIDRNSMSLTFGVVLCDSDNVIRFMSITLR